MPVGLTSGWTPHRARAPHTILQGKGGQATHCPGGCLRNRASPPHRAQITGPPLREARPSCVQKTLRSGLHVQGAFLPKWPHVDDVGSTAWSFPSAPAGFRASARGGGGAEHGILPCHTQVSTGSAGRAGSACPQVGLHTHGRRISCQRLWGHVHEVGATSRVRKPCPVSL